ncbi:MAG: putative baseplate assembly protein [Methylococcales bacterium]
MNELHCNTRPRREQVRRHTRLNGLDYLEVGRADQSEPSLENQRHLRVFFLGKAEVELGPGNIQIEGGRRIRNIKVTEVEIHRAESADFDDYMDLRVDRAGDYSSYTLRVVEKNAQNQTRPHSAFDPRYDRIEFNFKVDCPNDFDCKSMDVCPDETQPEPEINYLAKDYASFRQLLLDRLALLIPEWQERHVPELGIALVEVLAYAADHLSYYQDAVATEAYLNTARRRISVRRHARLVDYAMHEGCNARTWVCVETDSNLPEIDPRDLYFVTRLADVQVSASGLLSEEELQKQPASHYEVFEAVAGMPQDHVIRLYKDHSKIRFYTWGERECCLPRGTTQATLLGKWVNPEMRATDPHCEPDKKPGLGTTVPPTVSTIASASSEVPELHLRPGDVLILIEVKGPKTGQPQDADPAHRHAVCLTRLEADIDPLTGQSVVNIDWAEEDALPFPLCLSSLSSAPDCAWIDEVSIARGNVVLVDHGKTNVQELDVVPKQAEAQCCIGEDLATDTTVWSGPYKPMLEKGPLTFSQPLTGNTPASLALKQDVRQALPQIMLRGIPPGDRSCEPLFSWTDLTDRFALANRLQCPSNESSRMLLNRLSAATRSLLKKRDCRELSKNLDEALQEDLQALLANWSVQSDLLASNLDDRHFVVETDDNRFAHLRFGDHGLGLKPAAGTSFQASYRSGNGRAGNVGAGVIAHLVWKDHSLDGGNIQISNPLPAQGGTEPEAVAEVKLFAPGAFRKLERAVIADDYAAIVVRDFKTKVQNAAAGLCWNGSWYEVRTAVDALGVEIADDALLTQVTERLHRFRRIGHDLEVKSADRVALDITIRVCVLPNYLRGHVKAELLAVFSNKPRPNGKRGIFHPDELSFGDDVYLSKLIAAAQAVEGVESVAVTTFQRLGEPPNDEIESGVVRLGSFEIARLDNDPGFPENGRITLDIRGGR